MSMDGKYFRASAVTRLTGTPPTSATTKRQSPNGGVMAPMINAMIMTIAKCTGSIPRDVTAGMTIGVSNRAAEAVSRKQPMMRKTTVQTRNISVWLLPASAPRMPRRAWGSPSIVTIHAKKLATDIRSMKTPAVRTVSVKVSQRPFQVSSL